MVGQPPSDAGDRGREGRDALDPGGRPAPPDLDAPARALTRRFPAPAVAGTGLVLAEADADHLCVFWRLASADLGPAAASFASGGVGAIPVLRLRRLTGAGAETVRELPLRLAGPRGVGEQRLGVDAAPARYEVELGLTDPSGGWVMLARSNAVDHGARLEPRLELHETSEARRSSGVGASHGDATIESVAAGQGGSVSPEADSDSRSHARGAERVEPTSEPGAFARQVAGSDADLAGFGESLPVSPRPLIGVPIEPLVYDRPAPRDLALMIEAELRVTGRGPPGALIDLFGRPYRIGPGGRFQFILSVDDLDLIRRAFELDPPALTDRPEDT